MVFDLRMGQYLPLSLPTQGGGNALGFNIPLSAYAAGDTVQLRIRYGGEPPQNANSFGSFRTATHGPSNSPVLWTLSQPYGARDWWPNFQPLGYKADTTELHVTTPAGFYAGGPGLLQIDTVNGEWVHRFGITILVRPPRGHCSERLRHLPAKSCAHRHHRLASGAQLFICRRHSGMAAATQRLVATHGESVPRFVW